jgi:hypothetical protein
MQMASNEQQPSRRRSSHEWTLPAFSVFLGLVMWAAAWTGGHPMLGLAMFGIMVAFGAIFVVGRRSESLRMMASGRHADERWRSIDLRATAFGGLVLVTAVIAGFIWELAHGRSGDPYAPLGAIAGASYLIALIWFRWRS